MWGLVTAFLRPKNHSILLIRLVVHILCWIWTVWLLAVHLFDPDLMTVPSLMINFFCGHSLHSEVWVHYGIHPVDLFAMMKCMSFDLGLYTVLVCAKWFCSWFTGCWWGCKLAMDSPWQMITQVFKISLDHRIFLAFLSFEMLDIDAYIRIVWEHWLNCWGQPTWLPCFL